MRSNQKRSGLNVVYMTL